MIHIKNRIDSRRRLAKVTFKNAAEALGPIVTGDDVFLITRGQFSMIDAILYAISQVERATISVWTWTVAQYEVEVLTSLMRDERIERGLLVIDVGAREKNRAIIDEWLSIFGAGSVAWIKNHAKIATVEGKCRKTGELLQVLFHGSLNLNANTRCENLCMSVNGPGFDMIREEEAKLERIESPTLADAYRNTGCGPMYPETFGKLKKFEISR